MNEKTKHKYPDPQSSNDYGRNDFCTSQKEKQNCSSDSAPSPTSSYSSAIGTSLPVKNSTVIPTSSLSNPTTTSSLMTLSTTSTVVYTPQADAAKTTTHAGVVAGAIIGSLVSVFLLILGVLLFLRRCRKRNQLPPSAEFMSPNDDPFHAQHDKSVLSRWMPHHTDSQRLVIESDNPPPFTVGSWKDPVLEKAASAERQQTEVLAHLDSRNAGRTYIDFEGRSYAI